VVNSEITRVFHRLFFTLPVGWRKWIFLWRETVLDFLKTNGPQFYGFIFCSIRNLIIFITFSVKAFLIRFYMIASFVNVFQFQHQTICTFLLWTKAKMLFFFLVLLFSVFVRVEWILLFSNLPLAFLPQAYRILDIKNSMVSRCCAKCFVTIDFVWLYFIFASYAWMCCFAVVARLDFDFYTSFAVDRITVFLFFCTVVFIIHFTRHSHASFALFHK